MRAESVDYINFSSGESQDEVQSIHIENGASLRFHDDNISFVTTDGDVSIPYANGRLITFSVNPASVETIADALDGTTQIVLQNKTLIVTGTTEVKSIVIYDTLGRIAAANSGVNEIGVANLSGGVYVAVASTADGTVTAKIAITH